LTVTPARIVIGALVLGGVLIAVFAGWGGLVVYVFFTAIAGGLALAASVGGGWIEGASRGRFRDRG
jgi:hypothetical protein